MKMNIHSVMKFSLLGLGFIKQLIPGEPLRYHHHLTCRSRIVNQVEIGRELRFSLEGRLLIAFGTLKRRMIVLILKFDVLDMVNERYIGHTTFPRGGCFSKLSLCSINLLDWNGRLSFAQLVKGELFILVLHDYRNLKWAERIIKLTFLKLDNKELFTFFTCVDKSILLFMRQDKKSLCAYDIYTRKLTIGETCIPTEEVAVQAAQLRFRREADRLGMF
nr:uncharacterized protein LOC117276762 [Nicotiana tomentosiformis]